MAATGVRLTPIGARNYIEGGLSTVVQPPRPSTWTTAAGTYLRLLQTIYENSFIWRPELLVTLLNL